MIRYHDDLMDSSLPKFYCQSSLFSLPVPPSHWEGFLLALLLAGGRLAGLNQAPRGFAAAVARAPHSMSCTKRMPRSSGIDRDMPRLVGVDSGVGLGGAHVLSRTR